MTEQDFLALSRAGYDRIPLTLETLADLDTPLSLYLKLADAPGTYLLESVIGGERFGRYSIIGLAARERIEVAAGRGRVIRDGSVVEEHDAGDPLAFVDDGLVNFNRRFTPFANRRGEHAGHMTRILFAALEGFRPIERVLAKLQQKSFHKQSRNHFSATQADRAFEHNEQHQERRQCNRDHDRPTGKQHLEQAARRDQRPGRTNGRD